MIPALVLTAGLATRLRPLSFVRAKAALPVAGEPLAQRILRQLAAGGVRDAVLNLHHLPHTLTTLLGDGGDVGVRVRYSWEVPVLGSAGGPRRALPLLGAATFLIVNGDTLTDAPLAPLAEAHAASGALVTMAVVPNTEPHRYSGLRVDTGGAVLGVEPRGSSRPSYHFIGVQAAERRAFLSLAPGRLANSVGELYADLIAAKPGCIRAAPCTATFWDIGTVHDYWTTSRAFDAQARPSAAPPSAHVAATARIIDSIVWDGVVIGAGAHVERCIVTDGVRVDPGASYTDMILRRGADGGTLSEPRNAEP